MGCRIQFSKGTFVNIIYVVSDECCDGDPIHSSLFVMLLLFLVTHVNPGPINRCSTSRFLHRQILLLLLLLAPLSPPGSCRYCFMYIGDLRRIRPVLDLETASTVRAKLNYCNSLFLNIDITQINRLQASQNALARAVTKTPQTPPHQSCSQKTPLAQNT